MSLFLNLLFETDSYSNEYLLAKFGFDTAVTDAGPVEPARPLALGAGRAAAWPAAHATVRVPRTTPRRSSVVS